METGFFETTPAEYQGIIDTNINDMPGEVSRRQFVKKLLPRRKEYGLMAKVVKEAAKVPIPFVRSNVYGAQQQYANTMNSARAMRVIIRERTGAQELRNRHITDSMVALGMIGLLFMAGAKVKDAIDGPEFASVPSQEETGAPPTAAQQPAATTIPPTAATVPAPAETFRSGNIVCTGPTELVTVGDSARIKDSYSPNLAMGYPNIPNRPEPQADQFWADVQTVLNGGTVDVREGTTFYKPTQCTLGGIALENLPRPQ